MEINVQAQQTPHYDVVIVGGGATGLSLLYGLQTALSQGKINKVMLIEKEECAAHIPGRSIALNLNTLSYFANIKLNTKPAFNLLEYLAPHLQIIKNILVKNQTWQQSLILEAKQHQVDQFGAVIDLGTLQQELEQLLPTYLAQLQLENPQVTVDLVKQAQVVSCVDQQELGAGKVLTVQDVNTKQEYTIGCSLAIIANGAKYIQGLNNYQHFIQVVEHQQWGAIADVTLSQPFNNLAIEFFTPHGPVAFLPKNNQQAVIVWCNRENEIKQAQQDPRKVIASLNQVLSNIGQNTLNTAINPQVQATKSLEALAHQVAQETTYPYTIQAYSDLAYFKLNAQYLKQLYAPNLAYLGNAAHTLHPVSGQGFNLAILGVQNFLTAVKQHLQANDNAKTDFANLVNPILLTYQHLHLPVTEKVFKRTNLLANEFTDTAIYGKILPNLGMFHLIAYPFLQDLIVKPSLGLS
ncbi:FAD-dependent monooxygenase [Psittacicella hinzii]|uniref:FAD-binding domain-containing protein n=1 Tax=Psittacicella hinzii TaxID=2028575 RepID=A0A3A1Y953_9GAMM|nr:NAD(P)/FAD-dependent oxidoreductase [Psittacicella hinzii]RIY34833.1 hypothetical protein CKF58_07585 [Psittacicella hinzii]